MIWVPAIQASHAEALIALGDLEGTGQFLKQALARVQLLDRSRREEAECVVRSMFSAFEDQEGERDIREASAVLRETRARQ